jgi:NAD-reducing hydrogenase large subunit
MAERIVISPVTRIEGHAKISIYLDDGGQVDSAQFHVVEFRGFEKICEGRPFHEMPALMARICGICPVSHVLASAKACDALLGVEVPPAATLLRRLMNTGRPAIAPLSFTFQPRLRWVSIRTRRSAIFGLAEKEPELARRGIRLRQFGQRIIEILGGRRIHPPFSAPGGMLEPFEASDKVEIEGWLPEAYESVKVALDRFKSMVDGFQEEIEYIGNFTLFSEW